MIFSGKVFGLKMLLTKCKYFKILISAIFAVCLAMPVFAINETDITDDDLESNLIFNEDEIIELQTDKPRITDKIFNKKDKEKETDKTKSSVLDLFKSSGYTFESGIIKNQKIHYFFHGGIDWTAQTHEDLSTTTAMSTNELHLETLFADNKTSLMISYNFTKDLDSANKFFQKFSGLYVSHKFNDNQLVEIGETRVPIGYEGGISTSNIKLFSRSQLSRNLGNYYSTGIKNIGKYKYGNYNIGIYDGSRSFRNNFKGYEFSALAAITPLEKFDGKYGHLQIGGSIDNGNSDNSYTVMGGHILYNYKKFYTDFEYLYADGLSGNHYGRGRAHGFYTTVGYFIKPKIEVLARYDFYQNLSNENVSQEYSAGLNYYFTPKIKLMFQYIYAMKDTSSNPSHKIYLGANFSTDYLFDLL
ncbi:MAG: OprO/OprP family phosphate-selective porin [Candidatus Gastranaerophilales bacterium]|nr:OprO/OprP family phosphate-selective porin [Candidatus Gastranaerophilales bacterium]